MKILFEWKDCWRLNNVDAYFLEIPIQEAGMEIMSRLNSKDREKLDSGIYQHQVNDWARSNPSLATPDNIYILFPVDGRECILEQPYYPYAGQWNFFNPFIEVMKSAESVTELLRTEGNQSGDS